MKITVNYDSNGKVVDEDYAWSTTTYDLNNIDEDEARRLCAGINDDNITVLGKANTEEKLKELFDDFVVNNLGEDIEDIRPDSLEFRGEGIYVVDGIAAGYFGVIDIKTCLDYYGVIDIKTCLDNEFEYMRDEDAKLYKIE